MEKNIVFLYHNYATIIALYRYPKPVPVCLKQTGFLLFTAKQYFLKNFIKKVNR